MSTHQLPEPRIGMAVVVRYRELILMGKRRGSHGAGTWSFPGGHVDPGETFELAARRELLEETGIVAHKLFPLTWSESYHVLENKRYVTLYAECWFDDRPVPELREPHKCDGWVWAPFYALPEPLFLPVENLLQTGFRFGERYGQFVQR